MNRLSTAPSAARAADADECFVYGSTMVSAMRLNLTARITRANLAVTVAITMLALATDGAAQQHAGTWRITAGAWAPWAAAARGSLSNATLRDRTLEFTPGQVIGPAPLGCARAEYDYVVTPAEGLFQGGLPEPAAAAARAVGVTRLPAMTLSVRCESGVFDYHFAAPDRLLVALDNVVWTLNRVQQPDGPGAVVQVLLSEHMTGDMGFTAVTVARKSRFLSAELSNMIGSYFRQPRLADEVPPINGDPFTNSQEYPNRFTIARVETNGSGATVRVIFRDGVRERPVVWLLRRVGSQWLLDDLRYDDGKTFRALLMSN